MRDGIQDTLRCPNTLTACPPPHVCDHHCRGTTHWCRDCQMRFLAKPTTLPDIYPPHPFDETAVCTGCGLDANEEIQRLRDDLDIARGAVDEAVADAANLRTEVERLIKEKFDLLDAVDKAVLVLESPDHWHERAAKALEILK